MPEEPLHDGMSCWNGPAHTVFKGTLDCPCLIFHKLYGALSCPIAGALTYMAMFRYGKFGELTCGLLWSRACYLDLFVIIAVFQDLRGTVLEDLEFLAIAA